MSDILQFCRPEEVGVHPGFVADYINEMERLGKMCHSFLMMRHGRVFAEGYYKPFDRDYKHRMYSTSKTFASAAIGMLYDEGRIKLTDKICDYFPDKLPENLHPWIAKMTIRDMLMMATCHKGSTYRRYDEDWLRTFFEPHSEPEREPGTSFKYDTSSSYTLDVLVERLTGKPFLDYLKDKGLRELGFSEDAWCVEAPEGYSWGGSGVMCTTRDLARFAMLFANGGVVGGKRYLSEDYVSQATSKQIENPSDRNDWSHGYGYGYQIWRIRNNAFAFCGMGGQTAIIIPEKDMIFAFTSDMQGDADAYQAIYQNIFEKIVYRMDGSETLPYDEAAYSELTALIGNLEVHVPKGNTTSAIEASVNKKTFGLGANKMGIASFELSFTEDGGEVCYHTDRGDRRIVFGKNRYEDTTFPESHYYGKRIGTPADREFRCLNTGFWKDERTFMIRTYVIDWYFGNMWTEFRFDGDNVNVKMTKVAEFFLDEYEGEAHGSRA